jgi:hypothetical protein
LADARDLGSRDESRGGSNPSARTKALSPRAAFQSTIRIDAAGIEKRE